MDKRLRRITREIEEKLTKNHKVVPEKEIRKLVLNLKGEQYLKTLFIATKHALENKMLRAAQLLSVCAVEKFPTNTDAMANLEALLTLSPPPACVWIILGRILPKNPDKNLILTLTKHIGNPEMEQIIEDIPDEIISKSGLLLSFKLKNSRKKSPETHNKLILLAQQKCTEGAFSTPETAELIIYLCESLLLEGRNQEIQQLTKQFIEETNSFTQVSPERLQIIKTFKSTSEANLGDPFIAIKTQILPSLLNQPASSTNAKLIYNIALLMTKIDLRETSAFLYRKAFEMDSSMPAPGFHALYQTSHSCDWEHRDDLTAKCLSAFSKPLAGGKSERTAARVIASCAFTATTLFDSLELQQQLLARSKEASADFPSPITRKFDNKISSGKLRVAYLSSDFYSHATAFLLSGLFEEHDQNKFEIHVFSYGFNDVNDPFRKRIRDAVGHRFLDVSRWSDDAIAASITNQNIDIAIELKGYTQNSRPFLLHKKPAPIQINYLGFPGSMGQSYIDYFISDQYTVTPDNRAQFSEKIVKLPVFYQPPDSNRRVSSESSKKSNNLPEAGIILGAFNSIYKLTPELFNFWLDLLENYSETYLWLLEPVGGARRRLLELVKLRNIPRERIIFAPFAEQSQHIERLKFIDIFMDTYPCVGHTTATDVLFRNVPLVTIAGETFASRVAASALFHIDCPELIAHSFEEYKKIIKKLIESPELRTELRAKIQKNTEAKELFNTKKYTSIWEHTLEILHNRWKEGKQPEDMEI